MGRPKKIVETETPSATVARIESDYDKEEARKAQVETPPFVTSAPPEVKTPEGEVKTEVPADKIKEGEGKFEGGKKKELKEGQQELAGLPPTKVKVREESKIYKIFETPNLELKYAVETIEEIKGANDQKAVKSRIRRKIKFRKGIDPDGKIYDAESPMIVNAIMKSG